MDYKMIKNARSNLRAYRLKHHISVRRFGARINRSGTWVSGFELGRYNAPVSADAMKLIANAMGITFKQLVTEPPNVITKMTKEERREGVKNLIRIFHEKKMGQIQFSRKIGMSGGFFGEVKMGSRLPSVESWWVIAEHLHMTVEELIGREKK